jgi:hypothetical protein
VFAARREYRGDLVRVGRKRDGERQLAVGGEPVALVWTQLFRLVEHGIGRKHGAQRSDQRNPVDRASVVDRVVHLCLDRAARPRAS